MKHTFKLAFVLLWSGNVFCQQWNTTGLNDNLNGTTFGTSTSNPINIYTNSINTAQFSTGNSLTSPWDFSGPFNPIGDGLRIMPQTGAFGHLDMFTGNQNTTHIKWGNSGSISGQNSRFEQHANGQGFFFNTVGGGVFKFAHSQIVNCFVGTNSFWRIGLQNDASNIAGARKLEVVDGDWQLRLNYGPGINGTGLSTDFLSNSAGNLQILPVQGRVGINAPSDPTATIDVFGDARIRDVETTNLVANIDFQKFENSLRLKKTEENLVVRA